MFRKIVFVFLMVFVQAAAAFDLAEYVHSHPAISYARGERKSTSVVGGIGAYQNQITVYDEKSNADSTSLNTTNNQFYIFGISLNKAIFKLNVPYLDSEETRQKLVDSKVLNMSLSYALSESLYLSAEYKYRKGFYSKNGDDETSIKKLSDLEMKQTTVSGVYIFNPEHKSFFVDSIIFDRRTDSSSWLIISRLSQYQLSGMRALNIHPNLTANTTTESMIKSFETSLAFSKNAFWQNWFIGGGFGLGLVGTISDTQLVDGKSESEQAFGVASTASLSTGWMGESFTFGFYIDYASSSIDLSAYRFSFGNGSAGLYLGYMF